MYKKRITNENIKFKELELKIFNFVCEYGRQLLKEIIEEIDKQILLVNKNNKLLKSHDIVKTTIKTIIGDCEIKRRKWYEYEEVKGKIVYKKTRYLVDEYLETQFEGAYSELMIELVLNVFKNSESYRKAAETFNKLTNQFISHETIRNIIISEGTKLKEIEKEKYKTMKKEELIPDEQNEVPMLFSEIDGLFVHLQGKDKKAIVDKMKDKAKKKNKDSEEELKLELEKIDKRRIFKEMKMICTHEGWDDTKRNNLINKKYVVGFDTQKKINEKFEILVKNNYNVDKIQYLVVNGDGAGWIKKVTIKDIEKKKIYQRDAFHICKELRSKLDKEDALQLEELFKTRNYDCMRDTLEALEPKYESEDRKNKYLCAKRYISEGLERYTDVIDKLPVAPEGVKYKGMGNAESNIYVLLSNKLDKGRKSFSLIGAESIAYVIKMMLTEDDAMETLKRKVKKDTSVIDWINAIEKKAKENKFQSKIDGIMNKYDYPVKSSITEVYSKLNLRLGEQNLGTMSF